MTTTSALAIITKAHQDAQKLPKGGTLTSVQQIDGLDRLNDLINLNATQGLKLWLETETTVTLVSGQQMYAISPTGDVVTTRKPLGVKEAAYWPASGEPRSLTPMSREEWTRQAGRSSTGSVNQYFVEKLYDRLNLHLWQTPDATEATGTVKVVLRNQATNPATIGASTNIPAEWAIYFRWALAADLATGAPAAIVNRCELKAREYKAMLEDQDIEDTPTTFQPDPQSARPSRFA